MAAVDLENLGPSAGVAECQRFGRAEFACKSAYFRSCPVASLAGPQTVLGKSEGLVSREERKELDLQALFEAAEGIRTLDLLHGKQFGAPRAEAECPCK